jgi:uncharacterized protein
MLARAALLLLLPARLLSTEVPFLAGRVTDLAGILSPEAIADLEHTLKAHEDSTSNQIAVLTVPNLEGESIEGFSMDVASAWKLGQRGKDNGVLLLIAREDRKVRIEVGRGLEGNLTDLACGRIIRGEILPRFKRGDYDGGTRAGVRAIISAIGGSFTAAEAAPERRALWMILFMALVFFLVVGLFTFVALFNKGFVSWFLYVFLLPFWGAFPVAMFGKSVGLTLLAIFALGFPLLKILITRTPGGLALQKRWVSSSGSLLGGMAPSHGGGSGSFSGGGGGFSGGGASGSW